MSVVFPASGSDVAMWDRWCSHAGREPDRDAIVHWTAGEEPFRWTRSGLITAASGYALRLQDAGVKEGEVCALIIRHRRNFYPLYMGISALGALPAVLAYPNPRLHPDKFREGLAGMASRSGLDWVLTERELKPTVGPLLSRAGSTVRGVLFPMEWEREVSGFGSLPLRRNAGAGAPCLLQHSSGTTGLQKAVVLSDQAVLEHVHRYGEAIALRPDDIIVSWLPLYHDMGLIACFYLPLCYGVPVVQIDPFEWVSAPVIFFEAVGRERGTLAWLPNFAYNLMADRVHEEDLEGIRLDSLRMLVNCSEPVRSESHDRFFRKFSPFGVRREALAACYAMAETTFAATQTIPGEEARRLRVDREAIARGRVVPAEAGEGARICVSSGVPIPGCELRAVDESGESLPGDAVGEIAIRSVSLFDGYRNYPEKTAEALRDGWYYTGDYGFRHRGEWYVIGRKKDIIILAGRNVYPEDIEDAMSQVPGVLPGRTIAFGTEDDATGTEQVFVVAETDITEEAERKRLRRAVVEAGMGIDVTVSRVYLAPPRWLIKSSAGKPSRSANRERTLNELAWK